MRLRHARRVDLPAVVDVWVDAFARDPYLRWIQPDDAGWPAFGRAWMTFIVEHTFERGHTYLADSGAVAAAWIPPDLALLGPGDIEHGHAILAEHGGAERADQALTTILAARGHSLAGPHWTLQYLGVRSAAQGAGTGTSAVSPMLATIDAEGLPCGLVSSNPRNVTFYERLGFAVVAAVETPDGAATLRPMHRSPRPHRSPPP